MSHTYLGPAYRIEFERLVIRCYNPKDALYLQKAFLGKYGILSNFINWTSFE